MYLCIYRYTYIYIYIYTRIYIYIYIYTPAYTDAYTHMYIASCFRILRPRPFLCCVFVLKMLKYNGLNSPMGPTGPRSLFEARSLNGTINILIFMH